ncbi:MFS transporter [Streptantibioticus rubrisoli]|uniref:MFS transporter n=1 Tax=Streptantibioticus rubrisoli TaxID=1387313 RepID=A0ABT1P6J8_9ACTN|nr:MFS transporter [Streptantibioticus rubrisoli]MCQ4040992.1 MFS transporter [Streptantibioticus rubrisoli]
MIENAKVPSARTSHPPRTAMLALVAVYAAGSLAGYLLPSVVERLTICLRLTATQAGVVGSALLFASAGTGFAFASRVARIGPRRLARAGLSLAAGGFAVAACADCAPLVMVGSIAGGFGSGAATAVASVDIAGRPDPQRALVLGLLATSAAAAGLYLLLPRRGGGHQLPFVALACVTAGVLPAVRRLPTMAQRAERRTETSTGRVAGLVLVAATLGWSAVQTALWSVSSRIGLERVGLSEAALGVVFALALGGGLAEVVGAGALGSRLGRAVPVGLGTAVIAACVAASSATRTAWAFTVGEVVWNTVYPVVFSHLIGMAAAIGAHGRWVVFAGSASSLGVAGGPLTGTLLSTRAGYPAMGAVLGATLLLAAVPLTAVALLADGWVPRRRMGDAVGRCAVALPEPELSGALVANPVPVVEIAEMVCDAGELGLPLVTATRRPLRKRCRVRRPRDWSVPGASTGTVRGNAVEQRM